MADIPDKLIGAIQVVAPTGEVLFGVMIGPNRWSAKLQPKPFTDSRKARAHAIRRTPQGWYWAICQLEILLDHQVPMSDAHKMNI